MPGAKRKTCRDDFWTGCISPEAREEKKKEKFEVFDVFWDKYHETMQKPKQYVARARREWDKLTKEEQQTACLLYTSTMNGIYKQGGRNTESDLFGENGKYVNSPTKSEQETEWY